MLYMNKHLQFLALPGFQPFFILEFIFYWMPIEMKLKQQIEGIMTGSLQKPHMLLSTGLFVFSVIYGGGVRLREIGYAKGLFRSKRLPCKVVSVGNITVGGTGKTPMVIYLARLLRELGYSVAVISRGYKGGSGKKGGVVSDGQTMFMNVEESGDEPFLMAGELINIPVVIGRNRYGAGMIVVRRFNPDVILLDDAFQHLSLARDLNIVLMDAKNPLGNGYLFPRGTLRESISSLKRCHAVVFTRADHNENTLQKRMGNQLNGLPVFQSSHAPYIARIIRAGGGTEKNEIVDEINVAWLRGKQVYVFSGIARNDDFRKMVARMGCSIIRFSSFPDHYKYTEKDVAKMIGAAVDAGAEYMLTTEKDFVRIEGVRHWPLDLVVMSVRIRFKDKTFNLFFKNRLSQILKKQLTAKDY